MGMGPMLRSKEGTYGEELEKELALLLREQHRQEAIDRERELNLFRSGSAPPTVEGSSNAVGGLFSHDIDDALPDLSGNKNSNGFLSEEELRSDPAYLSYYYSNAKLNPRLPPPMVSKEDWRFAHRLQAGSSCLGGIGDRRKVVAGDNRGSRSLFSMQPGFNSQKEEEVESRKLLSSSDWLDRGGDGLIGLSGLGLGGGQKSLANIIQDDRGHPTPVSGHPSRPASRNAFDDGVETLHNEMVSSGNAQSVAGMQSIGASTSHAFASSLGVSLSRSTTPDPQLIARAASPRLPPVGVRCGTTDKRNSNGTGSSSITESAELTAALSGMSLSANHMLDEENHLPSQIQQEINDHQNFLFDCQGGQNHVMQHSYLKKVEAGQFDLPSVPHSAPSMDLRVLGGCLPSGPNIRGATELPNVHRMGNHAAASALHVPLMDPLYMQYLRTAEYAAQVAAGFKDLSMDGHYMGNSYVDLLGLQKAYLGALLSPQKSQYTVPFLNKTGGLNHGYYGNPTYGLGMSYPGSPLGSPVLSEFPLGPGSPIRHNDQNICFPPGMRNISGGAMGSWHSDSGGNVNEGFVSSLLEEFKSNKTKCFELSEIAGHVVEFSADQYGSRFIQQKLETATTEEKNMVFEEIIPQALSLMTDVFGNYVIQKFFEHGSASQRRELANHLTGHVLTLGLQMYGCRVIQKAIEVVDLDQQTKMVKELDGHVMRCVRDQNGNHVIQKCIECIPQDSIQFIISSFYDQVVTLSTHPYGCRVIQRVLEHCDDPKTQRIVMDEILQCVCMLAQDQYGNYVVQHVLEHGKPHERSAIIKKLAGQIVHMSQQKFASNVVEKCLAFGGPVERQILVTEMLGSTDENEPLQAMMKDQFANYVVQKVLETCDDQHRELILSRIKVHLNALKKYTYGKHIVARVEKLVAAGERRIGLQPSYLS